MFSLPDSCIIHVLQLSAITSNTLTSNLLNWQSLLPDSAPFAALYTSVSQLPTVTLPEIQSRLDNGLTLFCQSQSNSRFMLIKAEGSRDYLALIAGMVKSKIPELQSPSGFRYQINHSEATLSVAKDKSDNFAAQDNCLFEEWFESEQLFGCLRHNTADSQAVYQLQPGLVHKANGGVLILPIRTLLSQPQLWFRLKQMVTSQRFQWAPVDESRPLPLTIPEMPLDLNIILVGDRYDLADLQEFEPEMTARALYGEFENDLLIRDDDDMAQWCRYINDIAQSHQLPPLNADMWPMFTRQAIRYTGDQLTLPLCPVWILDRLKEAAIYATAEITAESLQQAESTKRWRESYLFEKTQEEVELGQVNIETEGQVIGQINGLSVLEYPGHPLAFGDPSRITCVAHIGDGEITDVERKAELGGNIHAKGMMIMEAFLISELELEQQFPFSASMVFEQSYGEVDGDSASLAEFCVLISALSLQPINQHIAVTGSVDQFGNVQPIGGINEKVEGFFEVCQRRGLTGSQGVILPAANIRHLCLNDDVISAVRDGNFHLWSVESVSDALPILTGLPYRDDEAVSLLAIIQERIIQAGSLDKRRLPWFLRWMNWFNQG